MTIRVAFDLDHVIVNLLDAARSAIAVLADVPEDQIIDTWSYETPFTHTDAKIASLLKTDHAFWQREDILAAAQPMPGAREALRSIHEAGMLAGYITRRAAQAKGITRAWLDLNNIPEAELIHVGHHEETRNRQICKAETCLKIGATHLVDDHQGEIVSALRKGIKPVLVDHPLGREARSRWWSENSHVPMVSDVSHATEILLKNRERYRLQRSTLKKTNSPFTSR